MDETEKLLEMAKDCADMNGRDLFSVALISNLEDYARYKKERDEKEQVLQNLRIRYMELGRVNATSQMVHEPLYARAKRLSLEDIIEYANGLGSNDDVKTIQLMLYRLLAKECTADELDMINDMKPMRRPEVTNVFHGYSQYVETVKEQNINHG